MYKYLLTGVIVALLFNTPPTYAEDYYWVVKKLEKVKSTDIGKIKEVFGTIKKDDIVVAPVHWSPRICQFNKSIITYRDNIKRHVVSCTYAGNVRKKSK